MLMTGVSCCSVRVAIIVAVLLGVTKIFLVFRALAMRAFAARLGFQYLGPSAPDGGGIGWTWQGAEGMGPCQGERDGLAFFNFEIGPGFEVLAAERDGSVKNDPIRSGNRA